jgi:hypothetical protein
MGVGVGALLFLLLSQGRPALAEALMDGGLLAGVSRALSLGTGAIPFSLAELVVLGFLVRQGAGLAGEWRRRGRGQGRDRFARLLTRGSLRLGQDLGVLVALFVVLWGLQYPRPGLEVRLGLSPLEEVSVEEVESLARMAVSHTNHFYEVVHGSLDGGEPTPAAPRGELLTELEAGWERVASRYGLPERARLRHGSPKPLLATALVRPFGVAGMYFPFTGEALLLRDLPGVLLPKEMAHEMAHQRGFASEADANALAFLVARETADPRINYAGYVFLQGQLVGELALRDPDRAQAVREELAPGVVRDLQDRARYWAVARGWTRWVGLSLNDLMLRAHGVPEGVASYQRSTRIFLALARAEGEEALLPRSNP